MLDSIFRNIQPVVKNLLIINLLFFLAKFVFEGQGIPLTFELGLFYVDSPQFQPFQFATHFFMHADFPHIFFNMFGLLVFGNVLERVWGAKRFLLFYFTTAIGAAFLHQLVMGIELYNATGSFFPLADGILEVQGDMVAYPKTIEDFTNVWRTLNIPTVGASGAIYGLLAAVALLFPNTVVHLYFAIPVKMKWLALGLMVYSILRGFQHAQGDSVAHFAHLGGMLIAFILIKIWQRDKTQFY